MNRSDLAIDGAYLLTHRRFADNRGFFQELDRDQHPDYHPGCHTKQVSLSGSGPGVFRGIHTSDYHKIITCASGSLWDYIVDLRKDSPTYLRFTCTKLDAAVPTQLYIPAGCGHGYLSGPEGCNILYLQGGCWTPTNTLNFNWKDPIIGLRLPPSAPADIILSEVDANAKMLRDVFPELADRPDKSDLILIVGGSGQVGGALFDAFGRDKCVGTYQSVKNENATVQFDLAACGADPSLAEALVTQVFPSVVVICAGFTWVDGCEDAKEKAFAVNRDGPGHLAKAAKAIGARVVYYSTEYIFDGESGPYDETATPNPLNVYGQSKLEGEQVILKECPEALILRTTVVYGLDRQGKNFACQLLNKLNAGAEWTVVNDQVSSPTYNKDLANMTTALLAKGATGVFNTVGDAVMHRYQFACEIGEALGKDMSRIAQSPTTTANQKAKRPLSCGLTMTKFKEVCPDFKFHSVKEAMLDWKPN